MKQVWEFGLLITAMVTPQNFVVKRLSFPYDGYVHKLISLIAKTHRKGIDR